VTAVNSPLADALRERYVLERELGRGGMATVYLAQDLKHRRQVALKVLDPDVASVLGPERFRREIELAAQLQHPHILPVFDSGADNEQLWFTMPYVQGESLRDRIKRDGRLGVAEAVRLGQEIAGALDYAHRQGVIHRDVKPENVLLSDGHALVADFGIARSTRPAAGQSLTATGLSLGTPAYMAPEQAMGERDVDGRADQYALGCLVYELLAGVPPYSAPSAQAVVAKHLSQPVPDLRGARPDVPAAVAMAVGRAMSKQPDERFADAVEFSAALSSGSMAEMAPILGLRRRRWLMAAVGLILIALTLVLGRPYMPWTGPTAVSERKMLAVLPFENLGQPEDEYFADGLTEELTSRLASLSGLSVISRTSTRQYKHTTKALKQIGQELGVQYVLEGSVRWQRANGGPGRIRVTPQLIQVSDDSHMWTDRYDTTVVDVFAVQGDIAGRVASALDVALRDLDRTELEAKPTQNFEAYNYYLQGRALLDRGDPKSQREAAHMLETAVQLDPRFALAYFYLGIARYNVWAAVDRTPTQRVKADAAINEAARLAPDLLESRVARGWQHAERGEYDRALEQFEWVGQHYPNSSEAWWGIGDLRKRQGRWTEALASLKRAAELDPRSGFTNLHVAEVAWVLRDYSEARRYIERGLAVAPELVWLYSTKAAILGALGASPDSAGQVLRKAIHRFGVEKMGAEVLGLVRFLDAATRDTLAGLPVEAFGADSAEYFLGKAALFRADSKPQLEQAYADSARRILEVRGRGGADEAMVRAQLGVALAHLGREREAVSAAKRALELVPVSKDANRGVGLAEMMAQVYVMVGAEDAAIDELAYLLTIPSRISVPALRADPRWSPLHSYPRFQQLVAAMR
jgi:serine/threonine-protein kinase